MFQITQIKVQQQKKNQSKTPKLSLVRSIFFFRQYEGEKTFYCNSSHQI
jgi:hypothetical protein